jgi:SLT domain-containing protein
MILRPLEPSLPSSTDFLPAWSVVAQTQQHIAGSCWMITQPSHAALAGEFAAKLTGANLPKLDAALIRAIALHDAGWGMLDAQAIMRSRSVSQGPPKSFIACGVGEFVNAWEKSIDAAASASATGGYIVSHHFERIAKANAAQVPQESRETAERFLQNEAARQKQLAAKQKFSAQELETLTDVLQFCDLLSLYVCSGATQNVEFPEYFRTKSRLTVEGGKYGLAPTLIAPGTRFAVAALRHPATKETSGQQIEIRIA